MSTLDTLKRHRKVACPTCGAAVGDPCVAQFAGVPGIKIKAQLTHGMRVRAFHRAFPRGRKPTGPTTCNIPVRVPTALWRAFADRHGDKARAVLEGLLAC